MLDHLVGKWRYTLAGNDAPAQSGRPCRKRSKMIRLTIGAADLKHLDAVITTLSPNFKKNIAISMTIRREDDQAEQAGRAAI